MKSSPDIRIRIVRYFDDEIRGWTKKRAGDYGRGVASSKFRDKTGLYQRDTIDIRKQTTF